MRIVITGVNLPGRAFYRADGSDMDNVHVGIQIRQIPCELVAGDAAEARWVTDIDVVSKNGANDFRGPAVQGKVGERFIYLTWGNVGSDRGFERFRRAKLMLDRVASDVMESAINEGCLDAVVDLTDSRGGPRCARVDPPAVVWSVPVR